MARKVFISFRYSDGKDYKDELCELFNRSDDYINCSEDVDRSNMSESTIKDYLNSKLKQTSVTIVLLTPNAVSYDKNYWTGKYDDWLYDELRYSLEDREGNRTNGVVAIFTNEAKDKLFEMSTHKCSVCKNESSVKVIKDFDNLVRNNLMNVKSQYKKHKCDGVYNENDDSYISLISYDDFKQNINTHIDNAISKRDRIYQFDITKWL